jgi:hypothetical protein
MNLQINTIDDFRRIIAREPHYGSPVLPYSQEEDFKELDELFKNKRVAIVGPSPSLIGKNKGKEIDSYDIVCKVGQMWNIDEPVNYGEKMDVLFLGCFPSGSLVQGDNANEPNNLNNRNIKNIICPIKPCMPGVRDVHNRDIWKHYNYLKKKMPDIKFNNIGILSCLFDNMAKTRATLGTFAINYLLHSSAKEIGIYGFTWYDCRSYHPTYGQKAVAAGHGFPYKLEKNLLAHLINISKKKIYLNEEVKNSLN